MNLKLSYWFSVSRAIFRKKCQCCVFGKKAVLEATTGGFSRCLNFSAITWLTWDAFKHFCARSLGLQTTHLFTGFNLTTRDPYLTGLIEVSMNHILAEITNFTNCLEWREHKIIVLKSANKYQIIHCHNFKYILIDHFHHHSFLYQASFVKVVFSGARLTH